MNTITLAELYEKSQNLGENEIILDVRAPSEFSEGHIAGAINITHEEVDEHIENLKKYSKIYIHCLRGGRAKKAFDALADEGLNNTVACVEAGFLKWSELGYPIVK